MVKQIAALPGACFWCAVEKGHTGGRPTNPTYRWVCGGDTGYAQAIRIHFDPDVIGYGELLEIFIRPRIIIRNILRAKATPIHIASWRWPPKLSKFCKSYAARLKASAPV